MKKSAKCEISSHSCLYIVTDNMAKMKKTLRKEEKTYWEQNGFNDKLKKLLKWKDWEYDAYMLKQKKPKLPVGGKAPRKSSWGQLLEKLQLPKPIQHKRNEGIALEQWHFDKSEGIKRVLNYSLGSYHFNVW